MFSLETESRVRALQRSKTAENIKMAGGRPRNPPNLVPVDQVLTPQQVLDEEWTLLELIPAVNTTDNAIQWLARRGMLRNHLLCHVCGNGMTVSAYNDHIDGKRWKCLAQCRGATKSIRYVFFSSINKNDLCPQP